MKKRLLTFTVSISFYVLLTLFAGCAIPIKVADFPVLYVDKIDISDTVSYEEILSGLTVSDKPTPVDPLPPKDKSLYEPIIFASSNGFNKMNILVGNSYFSYDLLESKNQKELDKITEPTNVNITLYKDSARTAKKYLESAFIYKIEEDYIYLGTAGHCVSGKNLKYARIMFYDRKSFDVDLSTNIIGGKFSAAQGDYAMFRIPTSSIPYEELLKLKEVCYSKEAVDAVKQGDTLYSGNIYAKKTGKDYDKELKVVRNGDACFDFFAKADSVKKHLSYDTYFFTDGSLVGGQSGSAIFDIYGNAVGTCSGHIYAKGSGEKYRLGIFTTLYDIDTLYQKLKEK